MKKLGLIVNIVFLRHKNVIEPVLINFLIMSVRETKVRRLRYQPGDMVLLTSKFLVSK